MKSSVEAFVPPRVTDDMLRRRIERFLAKEMLPLSTNGSNDSWVGTSIGAVRDENQDRALIVFITYPNDPDKSCVLGVVCDGMGGLTSGDAAADLAISSFVSQFLRLPRQPYSARLELAALAANKAVYDAMKGRGGSTISAAVTDRGGKITAVSVGDSRVYGITQLREVKQLSRDDTIGEFFAPKNGDAVNRNQLIQFIGMGEGIEPQILVHKQTEFASILITSDGIHSVPSDAFQQAVRAVGPEQNLVEHLIKLSDSLGGRDNGTAVLLPAHPAASTVELEQGLTIEIWSASDCLEIWIPLLAETVGQKQLPLALAQASGVEDEREKPTRAKRRKSKRNPKGQPKQKSGPDKEAAKQKKHGADQPNLNMNFPEKNGNS